MDLNHRPLVPARRSLCTHLDLNQGPPVCDTGALPLSYACAALAGGCDTSALPLSYGLIFRSSYLPYVPSRQF